MKVLIAQPNIRRYRADFFTALSEEVEHLTVFHFGVDESDSQSHFRRVAHGNSFWGRLTSIPKLLKEQYRHDVSIVVFDVHFWHVLLAAWIGSAFRPVLFWGHGLGRSQTGQALRRLCLLWGKGVIVYGDAGRQQLLRSGVNHQHIFIARNTLVVPDYKDTSSCKKACFLYVGRLQERKRLDYLLKAYKRYRNLAKDASLDLVILGDGQIEATLKQLAHELVLDQTVDFIAGTTDPKKLEPLFSKALAYVSPGDIGLGLLHAFSFGVPVITNRLPTHGPEFENLKDEENGLLVDNNSDELARAMLRLTLNPDFAAQLGRSAFRTYENSAHPNNMVEQFMRAINYAIYDRS